MQMAEEAAGGGGAADQPREAGVVITEVPLCKFYGADEAAKNGILQIATATPFAEFKASKTGMFSFVYYYKPPHDDPDQNPLTFITTAWYQGIKVYLEFLHRDLNALITEGQAINKRQAQEQLTKLDAAEGGDPIARRAVNAVIEEPDLAADYAARFATWGAIIYTDRATYPLLRKAFPFTQYPKLALAIVNWPMYMLKPTVVEYTIMRCLRYQATELFEGMPICVRDADTIYTQTLHLALMNASSATLTEKDRQQQKVLLYFFCRWEIEFLGLWGNIFTDKAELAAFYSYQHSLRGGFREPNLFPKVRFIEGDIVVGTMPIYSAEWHTNIPQQFPLRFERDYTKDLEYKRAIAQIGDIKYSSKQGVFAGFVNFANNNPKHVDLWKKCCEYLTKRYFIAEDPVRHVITISDFNCRAYSGHSIGKDERLILFVFPHVYPNNEWYNSPRIFYFNIEYSSVAKTASPTTDLEYPWYITTYSQAYYGAAAYMTPVYSRLLSPMYCRAALMTKRTFSDQEYAATFNEINSEYREFLKKTEGRDFKLEALSSIQACVPLVREEDVFMSQRPVIALEEIVQALPEVNTSANIHGEYAAYVSTSHAEWLAKYAPPPPQPLPPLDVAGGGGAVSIVAEGAPPAAARLGGAAEAPATLASKGGRRPKKTLRRRGGNGRRRTTERKNTF
jgi:hypothetical protein